MFPCLRTCPRQLQQSVRWGAATSMSPRFREVEVSLPMASSEEPKPLQPLPLVRRAEVASALDVVAPARRRLPHVLGVRRAAVLVPLCLVEDTPSVLFTVRSQLVSTHKGEVSFPGGHRDEGETAVQTAAREAAEELGLPNRSYVDVLGCYHDMIALTGSHVTPVVGALLVDSTTGGVDGSGLAVNPDEVSSFFTLPIAHLLDESNRDFEYINVPYDAKSARHRVPVFHGGAEPIWGLTAYILDLLLKDVLAPLGDQ